MESDHDLHIRVAILERARGRDRAIIAILGVFLISALAIHARREDPKDLKLASLTVDRIVVQDDQGRPRIILAEDPPNVQRRSRSCGLTLLDATGAERGGMGTFDDLSVVLGLDSPAGVGAPMRDRIGLVVGEDGSARIDLINNDTLLPVRLVSDADGNGGVEFFDYDLAKKKCTVTRLNHKGQSQRVLPLGDGK
ncbi:MAG: hypothetical protein ACREJC_13755 [Tepidisphaeraceae bacterium]